MKNIILLSWNVRGIRGSCNRRNLKELVLKSKANILCLQEMKCVEVSNFLKGSIWDVQTHGWIVQKAKGLLRGLLNSLDSEIYKCLGFAQCQNWIWAQLKIIENDTIFSLINIFSP